MIYNFQIHHRRTIRLKGYDYSQPGVYFVTMVTWGRVCLFGEVVNSAMRLNSFGKIATDCWQAIPKHFHHVEQDKFIVMPNHVHGIVHIVGTTHASSLRTAADNYPKARHASPLQAFPIPHEPSRGPKSQSIAAIIGSYKSAVTRQINRLRSTPGAVVWQRNYYEHVVRNEDEWSRIRDYIVFNPVRWVDDYENPDNEKGDACVAPTASSLQFSDFRHE